jgi:GntR family transcriptional regulator
VDFKVDPNSDTPPSQQIVAALLDAIARGELGDGDRLPSVRQFAAEVLVNPNTVTKAWRELEHLGVVNGRNGSGVYVTQDGPQRAQQLRGEATRRAFVQAAEQALRAGNGADALLALLAEVLKGELEITGRRS